MSASGIQPEAGPRMNSAVGGGAAPAVSHGIVSRVLIKNALKPAWNEEVEILYVLKTVRNAGDEAGIRLLSFPHEDRRKRIRFRRPRRPIERDERREVGQRRLARLKRRDAQ